DGPRKHIRAAALAAALVPLASVMATPASAQTVCPSAGVLCGTVFNDLNNDGVQEAGEPGLPDVTVTICQLCNGTDDVTTTTGPDGTFAFNVSASDKFTVSAQVPTGTQPSPVASSPGLPSNVGVSGGGGLSSVPNIQAFGNSTDFGFHASSASNPGTGTPGYWKNHPNAWPANFSLTLGSQTFNEPQATAWLNNVGKDRTTAMFASLVPAILNVAIGNDGSCINATIAAAEQWLIANGGVGSGVTGGSAAWQVGDPIHNTLDAYNNG